MVQKADKALLVFVPDDIPTDEGEHSTNEGVFVKVNITSSAYIGGSGLEGLVQGRMIYVEGWLTITEEKLPEVKLNTLLVFWRKMEDFALPPYLLETFLEDVGVSSHLRKLPKGMKASKRQRLLVAKAGIILPKGYTYVTEHARKQEKTQEKDL